tara:strand:+ start:58 stop:507 length:450 start_codon:yes stop_codon:yes gene_type:complete
MKKILIILITLLFSSCGYESLYSKKKNFDLEYKMITLSGDKNFNRRILNTLSIEEKDSILFNNELLLESNIGIYETSKDNKGQVKTFRTTATTSLIIKNNDIVNKNKKFTQSFSYNNMENKFDLVEYQKEIENNLIGKIIEDIIIFMNL